MKYTLLSTIYYQDKKHEAYRIEYANRYNSPAAVHINFRIHNNQAFYLNTADITNLISEIYSNLRTMEKALSQLPRAAQSFYSQTCLIDEIILSNDIEHVYSSRKDVTNVLSILEDSTEIPVRMRLYGMVQKYRLLSNEHAMLDIDSPENIRQIYDDLILPEITKQDEKPDGKLFRTSAVNVISSTGKVKHTGIYGEENIYTTLTQALAILNKQPTSLIDIAIFHYLFGYIHPFYEGNGRLSRFISSYKIADLLHPLVACRLSYVIKNNLSAYYNAFDDCNNPQNLGDLTPFIIFFLNMISQSVFSLIDKITDGLQKLSHYEDTLDAIELIGRNKSFTHLLIQQAIFAPEEPFTINEISQISHLSISTCRNSIKNLQNINIPIITTFAGHQKLYTIDLNKLDASIQPTD